MRMKTRDDIIRMIEEEGVEFIRLQFSDIFGILKNIAVTPGQLDKILQNKFSVDGSSVFGDRYDYDDELFLYPEPDTFMILPWRPQQGKVAKIVCDICHEDGTPFAQSARYILKNALKKVTDEGYTVMADPECEFFLFHTDENGLPTTQSHEMAGYLDVSPADFGENARRDIVLMLEEMGFEVESSHHEHAPAQHEIDFQEAEALQTADAIQTFRFAVRSIAKRFGLYATFMPKPKADVAGSGMHINMTLLKDGKNVFRNRDGSISDEARYFTGGILKHAKAIAAISNPTVNSYKRLCSGCKAPGRITWSVKGEKTLVRVRQGIDDVKIELRFPDGASNPYLLFAVCVAAGFDGITNRIDPGREYDATCAASDFDAMPEDLKEAVQCLKEDPVIVDALGKEFTDIFADIKNREWRDYMSEVSDWEIKRYLGKL
ncbi:MAG: glutamine synthetase [Lachnospiraceae bacterium]|nr:glutamine synthetase [Lachnospiraceae bacterium]